MIAGSGSSLRLLQIEFPALKFFEIASYGISYPSRGPLLVHLFLKIPSLLSVIKKEHSEIADIVQNESIDFIISDNRYGCYHERVPSAIVIHQLSIRASAFTRIVNHHNRNFIKHFNACWVPDTPDHKLSGKLSVNNSIKHRFIGPLSRMKSVETKEHFHLLGLVSGPEPHRTTFDTILTHQLKESGLSYRLVRGLPLLEAADGPVFTHLPSNQLNELIGGAEVVVCRSGYSTIMDLAALGKKAIFVPTPGQTEQLYLAKEMERQKIAPYVLQGDLDLPKALERMKDFTGFTEDHFKNNLLQSTLSEFLD